MCEAATPAMALVMLCPKQMHDLCWAKYSQDLQSLFMIPLALLIGVVKREMLLCIAGCHAHSRKFIRHSLRRCSCWHSRFVDRSIDGIPEIRRDDEGERRGLADGERVTACIICGPTTATRYLERPSQIQRLDSQNGGQ